ncbi:MAG: hypothetical protein CML94_04310 [Rhodobiaceae bacterium]|nr:hypothetical protein [Rhodobiaceae bacterium]|tara:strand:- start:2462 stop:2893 length:432 start_codon:yes stop_codon:yes gene_type:complete
MSDALKLIAQDDEQLTVISSLAQDSIIKTNEMGYDKKTKRFALLMNRYRHEEENPSRIRTAIHFDFVDSVKSVGIDKHSSDDILVLLAIRFESKLKPSGSIFLEFSNNKSVTVDVESIEAFLTDMGEPWKIPNKPVHDEGYYG